MAVRPEFVNSDPVSLSDVPLGVPFTFYHWRGQNNAEEYDKFIRVDNVRAVGHSYYKTARKPGPSEVAVCHTGTFRTTFSSGHNQVHLIQYKEVADEQSRTSKKRTKRH